MSFPTWSDLNDEALILPVGKRYVADLGPFAVMVSTESDIRYIESNCGKKQSMPFFLGNLFTLNNDQRVSFTGPYLGSPCAAMVLESLSARGVSKVIVIGWCGTISDQLKTGDILIPDAAICDEGTSRNYMQMPEKTNFPTVFPSCSLNFKLQFALENRVFCNTKEIGCKSGKIWTTDAIYRETQKKVDFFKDMGAVAVEMECSALFAVANYRKIDLSAILIVSDDLSSSKWKPGFKSEQFRESRKRVLGAIAEVMADIADTY